MGNEEHSAILQKGVEVWNQWRRDNPDIDPQLSNYDLNNFNLSGINLSKCELTNFDFRNINLSGANFTQAFLLKADFAFSNLTNTNFTNADLRHSDFTQVQLNNTIFDHAHLSYANLSFAKFNKTKFRGANLRQTELRCLDLSDLDFSNADLSDLNLSSAKFIRANLSGANLSRSQVLWTDFTAANLTGACIQNWNANRNTNLSDVICDYIYLRQDQQERRPSSGEFAHGEFTKLFQKTLETVDLIFRNGVDSKAFAYSFRKIQIENESSELTIRSIEVIDDIVLVKVNISEQADKTQFHSDFFKGYDFAKKELEPLHQARLADKDKEINRLVLSLDKAYDKLGEVPKLMAEQPKVQQNFHASVYGVAGNVEGDFNNYLPEQKQNLAEAAADIQKILNQLVQTNPTTDVVTEAIHQEIKRNPTLKARLISALEAGVLEGLKTFVNHPLFNIPAETIKGFLEAE
jgi:uncharacterized protein YjbI with pentapeptide repeats